MYFFAHAAFKALVLYIHANVPRLNNERGAFDDISLPLYVQSSSGRELVELNLYMYLYVNVGELAN